MLSVFEVLKLNERLRFRYKDVLTLVYGVGEIPHVATASVKFRDTGKEPDLAVE